MSETLGDIGERAAIARLCSHIGDAAGLKVGPGDDCAVVTAGPGATHDWVLTSDPVIEGVHFTPGVERQAVGHKAIGRVLSDIAAMGAEPACALVDLAAPADTPLSDLDALYAGATALAETHGCAIAGGDVAEAKVLALHLFGLGRVPAGQAVLRSGARAGDAIYVTGALGGSFADGHLAFEPRVREGQWLRGWATAMIDVSDGLASDLRRIGESSGRGFVVELEQLPLSAAVPPDIPDDERYRHALTDGEDYELLFAVPAEKTADFDAAWRAAFALPATCIGRLTSDTDETVCIAPDGGRTELPERGFLHFGD